MSYDTFFEISQKYAGDKTELTKSFFYRAKLDKATFYTTITIGYILKVMLIYETYLPQ